MDLGCAFLFTYDHVSGKYIILPLLGLVRPEHVSQEASKAFASETSMCFLNMHIPIVIQLDLWKMAQEYAFLLSGLSHPLSRENFTFLLLRNSK